MMIDQPARQMAMRGGLAWLDRRMPAALRQDVPRLRRRRERTAVLDDIAWPQKREAGVRARRRVLQQLPRPDRERASGRRRWAWRICSTWATPSCRSGTAARRGAEEARPDRRQPNEPAPMSVARRFLASFLVLFLEVALIRWMPAHVRLLAYFSNFILLASFLGIGVGCLLRRSRGAPVRLVSAAAAGGDRRASTLAARGRGPDRRQHLFLERHGDSGGRRREHDAAAAALRHRRRAVRDRGAAHGARDGGAAAAARIHDRPAGQPGRRRRVRA